MMILEHEQKYNDAKALLMTTIFLISKYTPTSIENTQQIAKFKQDLVLKFHLGVLVLIL